MRYHCLERKINKKFWITLIIGTSILIFYYYTNVTKKLSSQISELEISAIDCVYTWVNGSDAIFLENLKKYNNRIDASRYDDKNELKYSLRSLSKYAPWIRKIYLVTNGQIPYWLNLEHPKITVVAHDQLCRDEECNFLPTFSSSAIETWIHRIPNLSKRFLYMNDDIFLGAPLYPDDLYTLSNGVKVFTAWSVPDCSPECPWVYIGDGSCDQHCNIERCQFDGGDCSLVEDIHAIPNYPDSEEPIRKPIRTMLNLRRPPHFSELMDRRQQLSNATNQHVKSLVEKYNDQKLAKSKVHHKEEKPSPPIEEEAVNEHDEFAQTLIYTNRILNLAYGFHYSRKVLAHVGFFMDRDILEEMQEKFAKEVLKTRSNRFRSGEDLQYAFTYYNFLMSEKHNLSVAEIFDEFDTDLSGSWSDREIRTLLTKIYNLPLDWSAVRYFENVIFNCTLANYWLHNGLKQVEEDEVLPTLVYERYEDSNIPTVTKKLVVNCPELAEMLSTNFATRSRYKFHVHPKSGSDSNFKMLQSNVTQVVDVLDQLRKQPKKFNCINDNLSSDERLQEDNQLIRSLLEDFYLSFFPKPSQYELAMHFRNRFHYLNDYHKWTRRRWILEMVCYLLAVIALIGCSRMLCFRHRVKYVGKLVNGLFK